MYLILKMQTGWSIKSDDNDRKVKEYLIRRRDSTKKQDFALKTSSVKITRSAKIR